MKFLYFSKYSPLLLNICSFSLLFFYYSNTQLLLFLFKEVIFLNFSFLEFYVNKNTNYSYAAHHIAFIWTETSDSTISTNQSRSRKAHMRLSSQYISCLLRNPKIHCRVHKIPTLVHTLIQWNPLLTIKPIFYINFNSSSFPRLFLPSRPSVQCFSLKLYRPYISHFSRAFYMPRPCHSPGFYYSKSIWWIQIMKLHLLLLCLFRLNTIIVITFNTSAVTGDLSKVR
jgi:hypothetical protein